MYRFCGTPEEDALNTAAEEEVEEEAAAVVVVVSLWIGRPQR